MEAGLPRLPGRRLAGANRRAAACVEPAVSRRRGLPALSAAGDALSVAGFPHRAVVVTERDFALGDLSSGGAASNGYRAGRCPCLLCLYVPARGPRGGVRVLLPGGWLVVLRGGGSCDVGRGADLRTPAMPAGVDVSSGAAGATVSGSRQT